MNTNIKNACIFAGGIAVGFTACGVSIVKVAMTNDDIRKFVASKVSDKIYTIIFGDVEPPVGGKNYAFRDLIFETRKDAEDILNRAEEIISIYGCVSVADLYDLAGISGHYTDNKYGWTSLIKAKVIRVRGGYTLKLPKSLPLK